MLAVSATVANAGTGRRSVEAGDITLTRSGDQVTVAFTLDAGKKAAKSGYNLVVTPVIRNGGAERELTPVVVQGRRAKITALRHELAAKRNSYQQQEAIYMATGSSIEYRATLPYEHWMKGGRLVLDGISVGCCSSTDAPIGPIADNILYYTPQVDVQVVETRIVAPKRSTGDILAEQYPFVAPLSELEKARIMPGGLFDYDMPLNMGQGTGVMQNEIENFIDATREGSISIFFRQGKRDIDRGYMSNNSQLVELVSVVRTLVAADDSKAVRIVIAGFASPEGSTQVNNRLAWERAVAMKSFITANTAISPSMINIYNGSVDWMGLRELVSQSDMYQKYNVIDIIDTVPVWDGGRNRGRSGELMRLDGGDPYRYMLREFFPQLRQAAFIKVYYENK